MVRLRSQHEKEESGRDHLCFDTLLMWIKAIIQCHSTYEAAQARWEASRSKGGDGSLSLDERIKHNDEARDAFHVLTCARHDMLSAGAQFFLTRNWAILRKLLKEEIFADIDKFRNDVAILRNMHQHQIEYFKGEGQKPEHWEFKGEAWSADASSTVDGLWGARLAPSKFAGAASRLLPVLIPLDPVMIDRKKMFIRIALRNLKRDGRGRSLTDDDIKAVSEQIGASIDSVKEQAVDVESENKPPAPSG
jgi:hypothetical protein